MAETPIGEAPSTTKAELEGLSLGLTKKGVGRTEERLAAFWHRAAALAPTMDDVPLAHLRSAQQAWMTFAVAKRFVTNRKS